MSQYLETYSCADGRRSSLVICLRLVGSGFAAGFQRISEIVETVVRLVRSEGTKDSCEFW